MDMDKLAKHNNSITVVFQDNLACIHGNLEMISAIIYESQYKLDMVKEGKDSLD